MCVVHRKRHNDTLQGLSIRYKVNVKEIQIMNNLLGDQIWHLSEIYVPITEGFEYKK